jgi:alpha-ketoglutarate-dependent taurine dioxygenase
MSYELRGAATASVPGRIRRKAIRLSDEALIKTSYLADGAAAPLVVEPNAPDVNLATWAAGHADYVEGELLKHGALLFRGFNVDSIEKFAQFTRALSPELLSYSEPSSPRAEINDRIYTSTEYPATQWIQLHNEMSYAHQWPRKVFFYCQSPPETGGETPIASSKAVFEMLEPEIRAPFIEKRVMYVRNFGNGLDIPWQSVFGTSSRDEVEAYCRAAGIETEWKNGDCLRTSQVRQSVIRHPLTGDLVWFNQVHAFHLSTLDAPIRESLLAQLSERDAPRHAYYGDGTAIDDCVIARIREVYAQARITFKWRRNDVLLLENMLMAHGRAPFTGNRRILVAMSGLVSAPEVIS